MSPSSIGGRDVKKPNMDASVGRQEWVRRCRQAEDLGLDVIAVPDHLGLTAPFPPLVLAAQVTERVRLTTLTLSTAFYNPTLPARDVVSVDRCTNGRCMTELAKVLSRLR
jgi:alkanesulfonate monooxygenase SsuD/methylene tetrahydromethanopterin reductase-like flavin-dependent oxidoreductase (luciferase family)